MSLTASGTLDAGAAAVPGQFGEQPVPATSTFSFSIRARHRRGPCARSGTLGLDVVRRPCPSWSMGVWDQGSGLSTSPAQRSTRRAARGFRPPPARAAGRRLSDRWSPRGRPRGSPAADPGRDMSNTTIGIFVVTAERPRRCGVHDREGPWSSRRGSRISSGTWWPSGWVRVGRRRRRSTPEWVPLTSASASSSAQRSAAAVSVVKNGLPVPAAKITTRPFSR